VRLRLKGLQFKSDLGKIVSKTHFK
jgi:hypothetical protein